MNVNIQSLHFDASTQLIDFINKKLSKLEKNVDNTVATEVVLRLVNSEEKMNKEASIKLLLPEGELFASKRTDTFEESVVLVVEALAKQIDKYKFKKATELTKKN